MTRCRAELGCPPSSNAWACRIRPIDVRGSVMSSECRMDERTSVDCVYDSDECKTANSVNRTTSTDDETPELVPTDILNTITTEGRAAELWAVVRGVCGVVKSASDGR